ncbi:lytic transglycosylase domain-containing protein [Rhizobium sp. AB2/73]|uniref:lytic transglycosylase domain-containing protein n=1 Tax=Rhizobium sp. AB2/73 TaxID=2795216 RepID=UPI000DDF65A4|nr:lytic transglycosylase domain-containing protein [Rhizobium sp. AB2/73]QYA17504.1 lytic transglycosylase domain-containing protein [Rhizobium sp. AB2/73]UEQ85825.1 lytic transglycosylase domain-containing protein [Rhizobium sp. AB2/73]
MRAALLSAALLSAVSASIAWADVPVVDDTNLGEHKDRDTATSGIEDTDHNRYTIHTSVTCSMYRPGRRNDPVGAAEANPEISGLVRRVAREEGIDENQFLALVYQESRFNPCAKSAAGATGLSQLMPGTAAQLGVDENNIEQNLRGGARYYKQQLERYNGNVSLALAAYNSGPGNVNKYGGIPPFKETQGYVASITQQWLPAFGGSDKSAIPLNFGGGETAYTGMRSSTLNAMGTTAATQDSLANVASWYQQLGQLQTGTIQDSWDHNSTARNANLEMMNNVIRLGTAMADLINSRNAVSSANLSGSSRSSVRKHDDDKPRDVTELCDPRQNLVWSDEEKACVEKRELEDKVQLQLQTQ